MGMQSKKLFWVSLAAFVVLYLCYGLHRFTLGVDFTDEGAYLAWPLRTLFGERPFSSELLTLLRPIEICLALPFKLHPAMTLYEFRMAGWCMHLVAFAVLSVYLFRLGGGPLQSPLIASIPFFACNLFGIATPSYNTVSSDFLLIALSLRGLSTLHGPGGKMPWEIGGGLALFIATVAHPALGLVASVLLAVECLRNGLVRNLVARRLTPSNAGLVVFVACWLGLFFAAIWSGALADWLQRMALVRSFPADAPHDPLWHIFTRLLGYPFLFSPLAVVFSLVAIVAAAALHFFSATGRGERAGLAANLLAFLVVFSLIGTFSYGPHYLPVVFVLVCLILIGTLCLGRAACLSWVPGSSRFLLAMAGLSAVLYAGFTYYFTPYRSWQSGTLGLPFAFAVGLTLLLHTRPLRSGAYRLLLTVSLLIAVVCMVRDHYREIYRDAATPELRTAFQQPKLAHIKSTAERVAAIDGLHAYLSPRLVRGEPLLAFDGCPMLYYLLDAKPAYGLTWAVRYSQSRAALEQLNRELLARPLPRYAIRNLVELSQSAWATTERINYDDYPLNQTLLTHYELERTIFPFEIWRLKATRP